MKHSNTGEIAKYIVYFFSLIDLALRCAALRLASAVTAAFFFADFARLVRFIWLAYDFPPKKQILMYLFLLDFTVRTRPPRLTQESNAFGMIRGRRGGGSGLFQLKYTKKYKR